MGKCDVKILHEIGVLLSKFVAAFSVPQAFRGISKHGMDTRDQPLTALVV
jgi:hypothetical protein